MLLRNFTFGVEDSLVSTVGLLAGIAAANIDRATIIITGFVLIFVEAFSMAIGSLLSEQSAEEYEEKKEVSLSKPALAAGVMFVSYVVAGLVPVLPYLLMEKGTAFKVSIGMTLVALFMLGIFNARVNKVGALKDGLQTLVMGGIAIAVGIAVGQIAGSI